MRSAVFVAIAAAVGNFLQGWDNATIAGSVLYIKKEFNVYFLICVLSMLTYPLNVAHWLWPCISACQVRRYVYHDVVRLDDLEKLIDRSYVGARI
ncbi:hypothetical protein Scep_005133 [Stephania cephalantha]|uniref:Uncharacterized protein n=1 Tax=Stephania cephalantha TaxID=152367 RepID=A0AAP0PXX0_9MAGN